MVRHFEISLVTDTIAGSKASSPVETPRVDFQFLNFSHPSEAKTSQHRKQVRSHVTKQQHQREHALNAARRAASFQAGDVSDRSPVQRSHAATFPSEQQTSTEISGGSGSKPGSPNSLSQASSPGASPTANSPQSGVDPVSLYPEQWQPYVPRIMVSVYHVVVDRCNVLTVMVGSLPAKRGDRYTRHECFGIAASPPNKVLSFCAGQPSTATRSAIDGNITLQPNIRLAVTRYQSATITRDGDSRNQQRSGRRGPGHE